VLDVHEPFKKCICQTLSPLPPAVRQVSDSFELIAAPEVEQLIAQQQEAETAEGGGDDGDDEEAGGTGGGGGGTGGDDGDDEEAGGIDASNIADRVIAQTRERVDRST
jgi:hypothetical protein